jgi:hypothetical protein
MPYTNTLFRRARTLLCLLSLPFALYACKEGTGNNDIHLSPQVMEKVLLDISIAESYSMVVKDSTHKGGSKNVDSLAMYYKDIFDHHSITPAQFTESLEWYRKHPDQLDSLYSHMVTAGVKLEEQPIPAKK